MTILIRRQVFIEWRYSQSCWYFRPSFVNYCLSTFSLVHPPLPPSPLPCVKVQYVQYKQCVLGGGGCWVVLESIFCRSLTLCIWPDSETTKLLHHPKQKPRREEGASDRQTPAAKSLYGYIFLTTFCVAFYQSNLSQRILSSRPPFILITDYLLHDLSTFAAPLKSSFDDYLNAVTTQMI